MLSLSVAILTHNEEMNIVKCLSSALMVTDKIIIIDDFSTDRTVDIAQTASARVYQRKLDSFSNQRNYAIEQCVTEWILFIDADEEITLELAKKIKDIVATKPEIAAFALPRRNHFMGKWIKNCGWYPDYSYRLMKKGATRFSGLVHEHLNIDGAISKIEEPFDHYTYNSIEQYVNKLNKYTTLAALDMAQKGKKAKIADVIVHPIVAFVRLYILRKGIMDGLEGFIISSLSAFYVLVKYSKLFYLKEQSAERE